MCSFGSTSPLFLFLYHLVSNTKKARASICTTANSSAYQNPQVMVPVPQMDGIWVNVTYQTALNRASEQNTIPTINLLMKYGTWAETNSTTPIESIAVEMAWTKSGMTIQ